MQPSRRSLLVGLGTPTLFGLAGCLGADGEQERELMIRVRNHTDEGRRLRVEGTIGQDTVIQQRLSVPPTLSPEVRAVGTVFSLGQLSSDTQVTVEVTMVGSDRTGRATVTTDCAGNVAIRDKPARGSAVEVRVRDGGSLLVEGDEDSNRCFSDDNWDW
ncbi:hypothetical protein [Haloarchaeobius iranensis]|uniref:Lipoprotein n=1 Tax=Haloarchaeobius iranensis TaxID=996166 RepID=A0A1G9UZJ0_9EURY|nr:hypothetical protein [Haloarchaeobius iranensis]SDM65283.1 hypothetical protein SAMN05192554_10596 [Haloarchaeobius iranensis]